MIKVLVPTLRFPPLGGVGLRRLMKVTKYMAEAGIEIHFITTANPRQANNYEQDVPTENAVINTLPSLTLNNLIISTKPRGLRNIAIRILNRLIEPLYCIDYAFLWGAILIPYMIWYLKKNKINSIFCSGPPFSTVFHCALVKRMMGSKINIVAEWRDLWSEDYYRTYPFPRAFHKYFSKKAEDFSLETVDNIIAVTPRLGAVLRERFTESFPRITVIENGFDPHDFTKNTASQKKHRGIRLVYTGSVSGTRLDGLILLLEAISLLREEGFHVELEIVGEIVGRKEIENKYAKLIEENSLILAGLCSPSEAIEKIYNADYGVVLVQREHPEALTSKFFDYCALAKTILAVGPTGELEKRIQENGIGFHFNMDKENVVQELAATIKSNRRAPEKAFDKIIEQNSYKAIAVRIASLLC